MKQQPVIVKSAPLTRLRNERDVLKLFQSQAPGLRCLIDEVEDPCDPPSMVLEHLDDSLLYASNARKLTPPEIKFVAKRILSTLQVLHEDGYVHTGRQAPRYCGAHMISSQILIGRP